MSISHVSATEEPRAASGRGRYRALWCVGAAFWLAEWALLGLNARLAGGMTWPHAAVWGGIDAASWVALSVAIPVFAARFPARRGTLAPMAAGVAALAAGRLVLIWAATYPLIPVPAWYMALQLPANAFVALGFLGVVQAVRIAERQAQREGVAARLEAELAEAELRLVRVQLQPQSLFGALDSISALMRRDVAAADRELADLGQLLRVSLERARSELARGREASGAPRRPGPSVPFAPRILGWYVRRYGAWYLAFWATVTLIQVLARLAASGVGLLPGGVGIAVGRAMLMFGVWAPLGVPALLYAARYPIRPGRLAATVPGNLVVACATMAVYSLVRAAFATEPAGVLLRLSSDLPYSLEVTAAIVGLGHLVFYVEQLRRTEAGAHRLQAQLAESELRMLQMQLQPHFLFNVLNTVSALMRYDVPAADRMLRQVGRLLRLSLERAGREMVPLGDELEFLEIYLAIEQTRYQDRLRVRFAVSEAARRFMVPHLILQPLVENAIRHGIAPHPDPAELLVAAEVGGDARLHLEVRDWGAGLRAGPRRGGGLGIPATRARLEQRYGSAAAFEITSPAGGGTRVIVAVPAN